MMRNNSMHVECMVSLTIQELGNPLCCRSWKCVRNYYWLAGLLHWTQANWWWCNFKIHSWRMMYDYVLLGPKTLHLLIVFWCTDIFMILPKLWEINPKSKIWNAISSGGFLPAPSLHILLSSSWNYWIKPKCHTTCIIAVSTVRRTELGILLR